MRTLVLYGAVVTGAEKTVSHLFEKKTRIKKIFMSINGTGAAAALLDSFAFLTKNPVMGTPAAYGYLAHNSVGHLACMQLVMDFTTSGFGSVAKEMFIDLGEDYIEVEEDDHLYLVIYSTTGALNARAILYYEE